MTWTCQRVTGGVKCRCANSNRLRKCDGCGKPRPAKKRPAHMKALNLPYEEYVRINGGEHCGICGKPPKATRRLDRDHEHKADGKPRGLLCWACNRQLRTWATVEWLRAAADYLCRTGPDRKIGAIGATFSPCPTCRGAGEIRFNDSPNRDPQCDDSAPCGSCYGSGASAPVKKEEGS